MHSVLVLGAGRIGALISGMLAESGTYSVGLADAQPGVASKIVSAYGLPHLYGHVVDTRTPGELEQHLTAHPVDAIISALPYHCTIAIAESARRANTHYFDLTEDVAIAGRVRQIAEGAERAFVPQCGLAPGFISIAAMELMGRFDELRTVKLRVGALPQQPNNALKYSLTWSTEGLINQYGNQCQAVVDGKVVNVAPLEGLEELLVDGTPYEAFTTSGGLGSLAQTWASRCEAMDYKTIRYPGHCEQMRLLMCDLKLNHDRATLKRILENAIPQTNQDMVIVYAAVTGKQGDELREETYVKKVYPQEFAGCFWSAIQGTTASGVTAVVDLVLQQPDNFRGFVAQEQFRLADILGNRFGRCYGGDDREKSARTIVERRVGQPRSFRSIS